MNNVCRTIAHDAGFWVLVVVDCSRRSKSARNEVADLDSALRKEGALRLLKSLYAKHVFSHRAAEALIDRLRKCELRHTGLCLVQTTVHCFAKGVLATKGKVNILPLAPKVITIV